VKGWSPRPLDHGDLERVTRIELALPTWKDGALPLCNTRLLFKYTIMLYLSQMSIFISIASYEDPLLIKTIKDALNKAEYPDQIVFGLGLQYYNEPDISFLKDTQKRVLSWSPDSRPGVIRIRKMIRDLCEEDFFLQIDAHTTFKDGWDSGLISDLISIQTQENNPNIILSKQPTESRDSFVSEVGIPSKFIQNNFKNENFIHKFLFVPPTEHKKGSEKFVKTFGLSAGYIFADKNWVKNVPYDQYTHAIGEERYLSWLTYMYGWDVYGNFENDYVFHNQTAVDKLFSNMDIKRFDKHGNKSFSSDKYEDRHTTSYEMSLALIYNDYSKYAVKNPKRNTRDFFIEIGLGDLYQSEKERYDRLIKNEYCQEENPKY
jgi:hypothetical protein